MNRQIALFSLLAVAIAATVGCGNSSTSVPQFSKVVYFGAASGNPPTVIYSSNLDGSNVTPIPFSSTSVQSISSSADGKIVAFQSNGSIWVGNSDGTGQKQITPSAAQRGGGDSAAPAQVTYVYWVRLSPNGKKITYGDGNSVWVANADGTGSANLNSTYPANMSYCYDPSFSADSSQVVFVCGGKGPRGIYTIHADGSAMHTVEVRPNSNWTDYAFLTPDGKKVFFTSYDSQSGTISLFNVNIDGTGEKVIVPGGAETVILNSNLYYVANWCSSNQTIMKAKLDGTSPVAVSTGFGDLYAWYGGNC